MYEEKRIGILKEKAEWMRIADILMIASEILENKASSYIAMKVEEISNEIKNIAEK